MNTDTRNNMECCLFGWALAVVAAFFIMCAPVDAGGRHAHNHYIDVPSSVSQLSDSAYIVNDGGPTPTKICGGNADTVTPVPKLHALYVDCGGGVTWGDHRPVSSDYTTAMTTVGTSPIWWGAFVLFTLFVNVWWAVPAWGEIRTSRRRNKAQEAAAKIDAETRRKELARAYAAGEIDDKQFDEGLNRVFNILGK